MGCHDHLHSRDELYSWDGEPIDSVPMSSDVVQQTTFHSNVAQNMCTYSVRVLQAVAAQQQSGLLSEFGADRMMRITA